MISDIHGALDRVEKVGDRIASADLVVLAGDLTLKGGRAEAEALLDMVASRNGNIVAVHGNMDREEVNELLDERGYGLHGRGRIVDGVGFFGIGGSNPTPIRTRSEYSEGRIADLLSRGYDSVRDAETKVLVSHAPPKGLCDRTFFFIRAGSTALRDFLKAHGDVRLCLSGHIHEASGTCFEGGVCVVNAGALKSGRYAEIELGENITVQSGRLR